MIMRRFAALIAGAALSMTVTAAAQGAVFSIGVGPDGPSASMSAFMPFYNYAPAPAAVVVPMRPGYDVPVVVASPRAARKAARRARRAMERAVPAVVVTGLPGVAFYFDGDDDDDDDYEYYYRPRHHHHKKHWKKHAKHHKKHWKKHHKHHKHHHDDDDDDD